MPWKIHCDAGTITAGRQSVCTVLLQLIGNGHYFGAKTCKSTVIVRFRMRAQTRHRSATLVRISSLDENASWSLMANA
jgi:hypothetical protein